MSLVTYTKAPDSRLSVDFDVEKATTSHEREDSLDTGAERVGGFVSVVWRVDTLWTDPL